MIKNLGTLDKVIRIITGILIAVLYYTNVIHGLLAIVLLGLAAIFVVTSFINFCPIYFVLGIKTNKRKTTVG